MVKKRIMGLDVSSSTIGLSVVSYDNDKLEIEYMEHFKPPKKGNIFERLHKTSEYIASRVNELKPDEVALEDIVKFMKGKSTANTTTILSAFNRVVGMTVFDQLKKPPYLYDVNFIRKHIKITDKNPKKEDIPDLIEKVFDIKYPYFLNRNKKRAVENFDIADSIAVALCYIRIEQQGLSHEPPPKPKKKRKKKKK